MRVVGASLNVLRNIWVVLALGTQAVLSAGRFYENLIVNGDASSGNLNGWSQEKSGQCQIKTQCQKQVVAGPNNANVFDTKSCRIAQNIDVAFASKYIMTGRATVHVSAVLGGDSEDYSYFQVWELDKSGSSTKIVDSGSKYGSCQLFASEVPLRSSTVSLKVAFTSQQGGLGFTCDGWGTDFRLWLARETWSQSATITPPPTASPTHGRSVSHDISVSVSGGTYSLTKQATGSGSRTVSSDVSQSPSLSITPNSRSASPSPFITASSSESLTPSLEATRDSPTISMSPSSSGNITQLSPSLSTTDTINVGTKSDTLTATQSATHTEKTPSTTGSCGLPPIVSFSAGETSHAVMGGGITTATMAVTDLLDQPFVTVWLWFASEAANAWEVIPRHAPSGVATGGTVNASKVVNTSSVPFSISGLTNTSGGEEVWQLIVSVPPHGWAVTSKSIYVTQRFTVFASVLCTNGGSGDTFDYGVIVTAIGEPLPYVPLFGFVTTFAQSMSQVASGTVVPSSLSTMRALARLASCGTTDSGMDTSYGVVAVLVPLVQPLDLTSDGKLTLLNMLLCFLIGAFVVALSASMYSFLCGFVPMKDIMAHFHLPSLLAPVVMFAFPTVLGTSIAILALPDGNPEQSSTFVVGVLGISFCAALVLWICIVTVYVGPRRVTPRRHAISGAPPLPTCGELSVPKVLLWLKQSIMYTSRRTYSWRPLGGAMETSNTRWKYAHHILIQDVRFLLVPVAEAFCASVATVTTSLVTVPGVGCEAAICIIAVFYGLQTVWFLWSRPYASLLIHVYAAMANVLTLAATFALAMDIFQVENVYSVRFSVAFQVMLLGISMVKGSVDVFEFSQGTRRLYAWMMEMHQQRMSEGVDRIGVKCIVHYRSDEVPSDDDDDAHLCGAEDMYLSQYADDGGGSVGIELQPVLPLTPITPLHSSSMMLDMRPLSVDEASEMRHSPVDSDPETVSTQSAVRPHLRRSSSFDKGSSLDAVGKPQNSSFRGSSISIDEDAIYRTLWERHRRAGTKHPMQRRHSSRSGYTALMMDYPSEDLAEDDSVDRSIKLSGSAFPPLESDGQED